MWERASCSPYATINAVVPELGVGIQDVLRITDADRYPSTEQVPAKEPFSFHLAILGNLRFRDYGKMAHYVVPQVQGFPAAAIAALAQVRIVRKL